MGHCTQRKTRTSTFVVPGCPGQLTSFAAGPRRASFTPVPFTVEALESGVNPPNIHLSLGTHVALYGSAITAFMVKKGEAAPRRVAKMNYTIYPIVSIGQPLSKESAVDSGTNVFKVLILSDRFYSAAEMPQSPRTEYSISGLMLNGIRSVNLNEQHPIQSQI